MALTACSSAAPRRTTTTSSSAPLRTSSSPTSTAAALGCPSGATYCDKFDSTSSGWGVTNQPDYYYGYNAFMGGTYRIGSRAASTIDSSAPEQVHDISPQYGVRIDTDVVMNPSAPVDTGFGVTCWAHPSADGAAESAFVFFVYADHVKIVLWDAPHGHPVDVANSNVDLLEPIGTWNHLTATCVVGHDPSGAAVAQLDLQVNGRPAADAAYAAGAANAQWAPSSADAKSQAGVLASGAGADAFFDNVALTPQ